MMKSMKAGFTLAEVLTTLMVIGVVAAMTIPTLMNSTQNQQARVAAKKAASVLSQATQLFVAKEEECTIGSSDDPSEMLARCFSRVMSGSVDGNSITTPDGMIYHFYANREGTDMSQICMDSIVSFNGQGNCAVIVDTNGSAKGSSDYVAPDSLPAEGFSKNQIEENAGSDIIAFSLSATGARPMAVDGGNNYAYDYIVGSKSPSGGYKTYACVPKQITDPDDSSKKIDNAGVKCSGEYDSAYTQYDTITYTTGNCGASEKKIEANKAVKSGSCPKKSS